LARPTVISYVSVKDIVIRESVNVSIRAVFFRSTVVVEAAVIHEKINVFSPLKAIL
jgi:hypothetical protein